MNKKAIGMKLRALRGEKEAKSVAEELEIAQYFGKTVEENFFSE